MHNRARRCFTKTLEQESGGYKILGTTGSVGHGEKKDASSHRTRKKEGQTNTQRHRIKGGNQGSTGVWS